MPWSVSEGVGAGSAAGVSELAGAAAAGKEVEVLATLGTTVVVAASAVAFVVLVVLAAAGAQSLVKSTVADWGGIPPTVRVAVVVPTSMGMVSSVPRPASTK